MSRPEATVDMSAASRDDRPLANTYWVDPGRFAAGEYPGARNREEAATRLRTLLRAGIDHFIDLTETYDPLEPYAGIAAQEASRLDTKFVHALHPIVDGRVPRSPRETALIFDAIDKALDDGKSVYLHCWGGIGRTGTVVGCWFVRHGRTGEGALAQIAEWWRGMEKSYRRPHSPETDEQFAYVRRWTEPSPGGSAFGEATMRDRSRGCLLGLAVGDALGTTLEFKRPALMAIVVDLGPSCTYIV